MAEFNVFGFTTVSQKTMRNMKSCFATFDSHNVVHTNNFSTCCVEKVNSCVICSVRL